MTPAVDPLSLRVPPRTWRLAAATLEFWISMDFVLSILSFQSFGGAATAKGTLSIAATCFDLYHLTQADLYLEWIGSLSTPYSFKI